MVYAFKIMFDAEVTRSQAEDGTLNVLNRAVDSVLNFLNFFIRVITLMSKNEKKKK